MCRWFLRELREDDSFHQRIWFSDEAHFYLNGHVNNKNYVFWGLSKPDEIYERGLHDQKVTVWAAMSYQGIIGPFFFEDEQQQTVTVNSDRYIKTLSKFWRALGRVMGPNLLDQQWFQQDGAAPHVSRRALQWIDDHFQTKIISRRTDRPWSPNSPDLSPLDFHLWGFLKDGLCGREFQSTAQMKTAIIAGMRGIPQEQCRRVVDHFVVRARKCVERNGRHLEHVL